MAITAINIRKTQEFVSKHDKDTNNPTVFHLGFLSKELKSDIMDEATVWEADAKNPDGNAKTHLKYNRSNLELVRFSLKGIDNLIDPETKKPVEFRTIPVVRSGKTYNLPTQDILDMIPDEIITEMAERVRGINQLSEEESKN